MENQNVKITLEEFWNDKKGLAIHTRTKEQASLLCEAFKKMDKKWYKSPDIHIHDRAWEIHGEKGCYTNFGQFGNIDKLKFYGYKIYEFENVDLTVNVKEEAKADKTKEDEIDQLGDK